MKKLLVLLFITGSAFGQDKLEVISMEETRRIEEKLSSDEMQCRLTFTPGIEKAGQFIAAEFEKIGLKKLGNNDSYLQSFAMIRGGHVHLTILGAMEVSEHGDIANWKIPGKMVKGMGGAMDLVASAKNIIVAMQHCSKDGQSKLLPTCSLPLTGIRCVKKIVTDLAVLEIAPEGGFILKERAPNVSVDEIKSKTAGKLIILGEVPEMQFD
jgi:3-oxoacid CoA-transferase B subunit